MVTLDELQETLKEQAWTFTGISESLQALINYLTNQQPRSQKNKMESDNNDSINTGYHEPGLRQKAKLVQESPEQFDGNTLHDNPIYPFPRIRRERISFVKKAM